MKHYIIAKFTEGTDLRPLVPAIQALFNKTLTIPGIHAVRVKPCCIDRANRYDLMIEITMEKEALPAYDSSAPHHEWKEIYGSLLQAKTIFDSED